MDARHRAQQLQGRKVPLEEVAPSRHRPHLDQHLPSAGRGAGALDHLNAGNWVLEVVLGHNYGCLSSHGNFGWRIGGPTGRARIQYDVGFASTAVCQTDGSHELCKYIRVQMPRHQACLACEAAQILAVGSA